MTYAGPRDLDLVKELISPIISHDENTKLVEIPYEKEVKDVVFNLGSLKSTGPDGYPAKFYQHIWDTISRDIVNIVKSFFKYKFSLGKINKTFIVLISKKVKPPLCVILDL